MGLQSHKEVSLAAIMEDCGPCMYTCKHKKSTAEKKIASAIYFSAVPYNACAEDVVIQACS